MAVSFSVDLWAAAVTLFVMLCGKEPWRLSRPDDKPVDLQVMNDPLSFAGCGTMSDASVRLLRKMLMKDPDQRLTAMAAIKVEPFFIKINWDRVRLREDEQATAPPSNARAAGAFLLPSVASSHPRGKTPERVGDLENVMDRLRLDGMGSENR
ncbi:hypothetical protein HDZ31DRAFT_44790 [Schizophyllum fasciatum]